MRAQIDERCLINASAQFWEQMLAMTLDAIPQPYQFSAAAGHVLGTVNLSGVWTGRVEVRMAAGLAYHATAAMMMQPLDAIEPADALDATKEIANIIAGSIKSALPRPCSMTVPESGFQTEECPAQPASEDSLVVAFRHSSGDLVVRLWEQECQA